MLNQSVVDFFQGKIPKFKEDCAIFVTSYFFFIIKKRTVSIFLPFYVKFLPTTLKNQRVNNHFGGSISPPLGPRLNLTSCKLDY